MPRELFDHDTHRFNYSDRTGWENNHLKGPVQKLMLVSHYPIVNKDLVNEGPVVDDHEEYEDINHILEYDAQGKLTRSWQYGRNGSWHYHEYGPYGSTRYDEYQEGQLKRAHVTVYDGNGRVIRSGARNSKGEPIYDTTNVFEGDNTQWTRHEHIHHANLKFSTVETNELDAAGRAIRTERRRMADNELLSRISRTFDEHGNQVEYISENFEKHGEAQNYREVSVYDHKNNLIGYDRYKLDGSLVQTSRHPYEYDADGNKIVPPRPASPFTYQDRTDHHGNWIWRLMLENGIPVLVQVRTIIYHGEPMVEMEHPLATVRPKENDDHRRVRWSGMGSLKEESIPFMYGNETGPEQFPLVRYYTSEFKYAPTLKVYHGPIEAKAVLDDCLNSGGMELFRYTSVHNGWRRLQRYVLSFPMYPGYLLAAKDISTSRSDEYIIPKKVHHAMEGSVHTSTFHFLVPPANSELENRMHEEVIDAMMEEFFMKKRPEKPKVNIVEVRGNAYAMVERAVNDDFNIRDLDINYGHGFAKFDSELMTRFNTSSKGLVLFHGVPGTGKTFYIRHLLRKMALNKKAVIYMPPNMVDHLTDPTFMTFLTQSVQHWSNQGLCCVLLIEDAEPLLAKRQEGVRIQGVTNLLNMTDGILNDLLNLQIICTFNVDLRKLDSALLRPGRLLARKEFKPLSVLDANLLAQRLGVKHHFNRPATLGEIYAMQRDAHTLVHDVDPNRDGSTQTDDL